MTGNIETFLRDKPAVMTFRLEQAAQDLPALWEKIGAQGVLSAASAEFLGQHNAS